MVKKQITQTAGMVRAEYNFWVGKYLDRMYDGFERQEFVANKCGQCGKVFFPPRQVCGACNAHVPLDDGQAWITLPGTGTLVNFTATPYRISERRTRTRKKPDLVGLVQLDGSDTAVVYKILKATEADLEVGLKVQAVWNKKLRGEPGDVKGFALGEGGA